MTPDAPTGALAPTPRARAMVTGAIAVLAVVTTAAVSIAVDRGLHRRSGGEDEHTHDAAHGHDAEHDTEHAGPGQQPPSAGADPSVRGSEHAPHVDVATVRLTDAQRANAGLELVTAAGGRVDEIMVLPGEVSFDADRVAHVTPRAEGAVREVRADLGQLVKKGDVLAVLDSREVAAMQQEAMAARARRELAEASYRRLAPLFEDGITSEKDYLAARQALAEARIDEASAAQKLAAGAGPRSTATGLSLVAPLDGTVVEKHVTIGEVLAPGSQAFMIADLSRLWVWTTAHARELGRIRKGQRAYVRADGMAAPLVGQVDYVEAMLVERTRTARARILVEAPPEGWRPGMFVTAELAVGEVEAPVVAREDAIQRLGEHPVIFVEDDGLFEARPVELGRTGRDAEGHLVRAIDAGLRVGERYVGTNAFVLKAELGKGTARHEH